MPREKERSSVQREEDRVPEGKLLRVTVLQISSSFQACSSLVTTLLEGNSNWVLKCEKWQTLLMHLPTWCFMTRISHTKIGQSWKLKFALGLCLLPSVGSRILTHVIFIFILNITSNKNRRVRGKWKPGKFWFHPGLIESYFLLRNPRKQKTTGKCLIQKDPLSTWPAVKQRRKIPQMEKLNPRLHLSPNSSGAQNSGPPKLKARRAMTLKRLTSDPARRHRWLRP